MEDTLDIYERPYDLRFPVVNMDEASRQLIEETRPSFVNRHGIRCTDYEYIRHGTRDIFMATEPLGNWRTAIVTEHHTMTDWARFMRDHVIARYPDAEKIIIVMDNLATHTTASFYEAFPPEEAKALCNRIEIHYTPKHGSWLNVAEIELSVLQNQCLRKKYCATERELRDEVAAWTVQRNEQGGTVNWRFTTKDARNKLKHLYPKI